jgi:alkanesulfonate monooxygenase SsuD/methylene tetrahydromethanopterin reductase-like flavin-dependent oxidoreductase (luciferase family)
MKFGFIIPNGSSKQILKLAVEAEKAGWDGVFYYDDIYTDSETETSATWPIMAAMAVALFSLLLAYQSGRIENKDQF